MNSITLSLYIFLNSGLLSIEKEISCIVIWVWGLVKSCLSGKPIDSGNPFGKDYYCEALVSDTCALIVWQEPDMGHDELPQVEGFVETGERSREKGRTTRTFSISGDNVTTATKIVKLPSPLAAFSHHYYPWNMTDTRKWPATEHRK